jgi:hypothetical protein
MFGPSQDRRAIQNLLVKMLTVDVEIPSIEVQRCFLNSDCLQKYSNLFCASSLKTPK